MASCGGRDYAGPERAILCRRQTEHDAIDGHQGSSQLDAVLDRHASILLFWPTVYRKSGQRADRRASAERRSDRSTGGRQRFFFWRLLVGRLFFQRIAGTELGRFRRVLVL